MNWYFLLMLILLPIGLLLLLFGHRGKAAVLGQQGTPEIRQLALWQPYQELMLGFILTFAGLYFARRTFAGEVAWNLALAAAALIALLSTWGAYARFRASWCAVEFPQPGKQRVIRYQLSFCLGLASTLLALLAAFAWQLTEF